MSNKGHLYIIFPKILIVLIYLSFFLVQFNIHMNGSPLNISYFSSDYSSINCNKYTKTTQQIGKHNDDRPAGFKLNKRFHPEDLFTVLVISTLIRKIIFRIQAPQVLEEWPLTFYSYNSSLLRGPPSVV
jgi:hypothetical protein